MRLHYELTYWQYIAFMLAISLVAVNINLELDSGFVDIQAKLDANLEALLEGISNVTTAVEESNVVLAIITENQENMEVILSDLQLILVGVRTLLQDINKTDTQILYGVDSIRGNMDYIKPKVDSIFGEIVKIRDNSDNSLSNVTKIVSLMEPPAFAHRVLTVLNEDVLAITADSFLSLQIDLDVCEYDPLGIGPINCEGGQIEEIVLSGLEFNF